MKLLLTVLSTVAILAAGCSKSGNTDSAEAPAPVPGGKAKAADGKVSPAINSALQNVSADIKARNYDSAITKLAEMKELPKSPAEEAEYRARLIETQNELAQRAQTDPQAQQQYQALGRLMLGR